MSDAYSQPQQHRPRPARAIGSDEPEWLGRAHMSTSLSPLLAPMLSSAAMRAICDDAAYLQNMLDFEAALARAEAAVGVIPASAAGPIAKRLQGRIIRSRRAGRGRDPVRQSRHPAGQGADRRGRQDRCRGRALRALGRDQPGRHRYRRHARPARGDRCAARRYRPRHRRLRHAGATSIATPPMVGAHLAAACAADAVRAEARRICGGTCIARARGCSGCAARRWRCSSAAPPARWRRSATRASRSPRSSPRSSSCRCRMRPGTPIATASRKPPRCSPSSPAPAARSRAMCR